MNQLGPWPRKAKSTCHVNLDGRQHFLGRHSEGAPAPKKGKTGWDAPPSLLEAFDAKMRESHEAANPCTVPSPRE